MAVTLGLPEDYVENPVITDIDVGADYWTAERLASSARYQWAVYRLARRLADERRATTVLDVGCGPATKLEALFGGIQVFGLDQQATIDLCRRLGRRGEFASIDLSNPGANPFAPADVVICSDVVEHLADPRPLLGFLRTCCRPGGVVVMSTPDRDRLLGRAARVPSNPAHVREWSWEEFEVLLAREFRVVDHQRQLPFRLRFDGMTARWLYGRFRDRLPLRTNQVVVVSPT